MGQGRLTRDHYPRGYWPQERGAIEPNLEEGRYSEPQDIRRPPMALREQANVPGKFYFVAALGLDGKTTSFTAPYLPPSVDVREFFDVDKFERCMQRALSSNPSINQPYEDPGFGIDSDMSRHPMELGRRWTANRRYGEPTPLEAFEVEESHKTRKRPRVTALRRRSERSDPPLITPTPPKKTITIGDDKAVWQFYHDILKECQQNACKLIAKAWIKAVEPKKQSTHPYTGKDEKAPDWWPKPWGANKDEKVRHKEPDHLLRHERLYLLVHILRLIVEPAERQHPAVQKVHLNVSKLSDLTMDAMSSWFADKENPANATKQPLLKELFKLARAEERYKNDEIDSSASVFVTSIERVSQGGGSDAEELDSAKDEEEQQRHTPISSTASPQRVGTAHVTISHQQSIAPGPTHHMQGADYAGDLMVRGTQLPHPILGSELAPERTTHFEMSEMMSLPNIFPGQHDTSRKSSAFASPSEYASPTTPIYQQHWQNASTPPNNQAMYSFTSHQPGPQTNFVGQPGVHLTQSHQYVGASFDGLARGHHDSQSGPMFRPGGIGHASISHQQSYYDAPITPGGVKVETTLRNPPH
ncbi:hypothetical protein DL770_009937 [Monosporascus sp. CRB-9-2]|nr:hypothetical protein DL770_009937 [Monosporascus sp. CRB-9-2]